MAGKDAGMDGLDELMREFSNSSSTKSKASLKPVPEPTAQAAQAAGGSSSEKAAGGKKFGKKGSARVIDGFNEDGEFVGEEQQLPPRVSEFVSRLRQFQMRVADPSTRETLAQRLTASSANFQTTVKYYQEKPQLGQYTVQTELSRMAYTVVSPSGATMSTPTDIEAIRQLYKDMEANPDHAEDMLLWRFANQSLLADLLQVLQETFGKKEDIELCIAIHNTTSSFHVDFSKGKLQAVCEFAIATVGVRGAAMLKLAFMTGTITVEVRSKAITQAIKDLKLQMVFDDDLEAAARSLADGEAASGMEHQRNGNQTVSALRDGLLLTVGSATSTAASTAAAAGSGLFSGVMSLSGGVLSGISSIVLGGDEEPEPVKLYNRDP